MHCLHSLFSFQSSYTILHLKSYRRHPYTGICCSSIIAAVSSSSSSSSVVWHIWVEVDGRPLCSTGGWNRWVGERWSRHSLQFKLYNLFLQFRQLLSELPLIHCIQGLPMRGHILGNTGLKSMSKTDLRRLPKSADGNGFLTGRTHEKNTHTRRRKSY